MNDPLDPRQEPSWGPADAPAAPTPPGDDLPAPTFAPAAPAAPVSRVLPLQFTASGSEYFRIWIVNLLLILVTVGFYLPFAKARRLQYFYGNTLVDGHALAFHGDAWRMFRGYVLMLVLFGAYSVSGHVSSWLSLAVFVVLMALWPALWRSSLRFRLGNTSWRGLRFGFVGTVGDAYRVLLPLAIPSLFILGTNAWYLSGVDQSDKEAMAQAMQPVLAWNGVAMLTLLVMFPWSLAQIKRYQHNGYRYAQQVARMPLRTSSLYGTTFIAAGLGLLGVMLLGLLVAVGVGVGAILKDHVEHLPPWLLIGAGGLAMVVLVVAYLAVLFWVQGYFSARLQNLLWCTTRTQQVVFDSDLPSMRLVAMLLKNLLLTVITLGLYRPFAVVNVMRLRLEAVRIELIGSMDAWHAPEGHGAQGAAGEMAGDFFGIDMGL